MSVINVVAGVGLIAGVCTMSAIANNCSREFDRVDEHGNPITACSFSVPTAPSYACGNGSVTQDDTVKECYGGFTTGRSGCEYEPAYCQYSFPTEDAFGNCTGTTYVSVAYGGSGVNNLACPGGPGGIQ